MTDKIDEALIARLLTQEAGLLNLVLGHPEMGGMQYPDLRAIIDASPNLMSVEKNAIALNSGPETEDYIRSRIEAYRVRAAEEGDHMAVFLNKLAKERELRERAAEYGGPLN
jgi:hypothetical protein